MKVVDIQGLDGDVRHMYQIGVRPNQVIDPVSGACNSFANNAYHFIIGVIIQQFNVII